MREFPCTSRGVVYSWVTPRVAMYAKWARFFGSLTRDPQTDGDFGVPAIGYTHPCGAAYCIRDGGDIGNGGYGCVYVYKVVEPCAGVPEEFCVKCITHDAQAEVYAVRALSALTQMDMTLKGFVPAAVLRENGEFADVGMPLYRRTLSSKKMTIGAAMAVVAAVTSVVIRLWDAGLAYTDVKTSNVLEANKACVVLCDLGSIVPRRAHDGSYPQGLFTFPPRRSIDPVYEDEDGVVTPREYDVVWSLGTLLMTLTHGTPFVITRFTGAALRAMAADASHMSARVRLHKACSTVADETRREFEYMRATDGVAGIRCANAINVAIDAWAEKPNATLDAFLSALKGGPPRRRKSSPS